MNPNKQDPNKKSEEELKKLIDELKKNSEKRKSAFNFGFMLHRDYLIHILLSLAINTVILAVVMGIAIGIGDPLIEMNGILSFLLASMLLTLLENFVKILLYRFAFKAVLYSFGLLSVSITFVLFYVVDEILQGNFHFTNILNLLVFTIGFTFFRLVLSTYVRRFLYTKNMTLTGGK